MLEKELLNLTLADFRVRFDTWLRKYKLIATLGHLSRFTLDGTHFKADCAGRNIAGEFDSHSKRLLNIRLEDDFAWFYQEEDARNFEARRTMVLMTGLVHCVNHRIPMLEIKRILREIGIEDGRTTRDTRAFEHVGLRFTGGSSDASLWLFEITRASSSAVAPVL